MEQIILFAFLALYPFGQIIKIGIISPIDIIVGIGAFYAIIKKYKKPEVFKYFENFLILAVSSSLFGIFLFPSSQVLYGFLYLVRLTAYFYFFLLVSNFAKKNKPLLLNSLLTVGAASALFGWIQFFWVPDIKPFFVWGWDEHLFRLVGTFLDPTFLGLIIVFGSIIAIYKKKWLLTLFLIISLAFTYSRASYLAFAAGVLSIGFFENKIKKLLPLLLGLLILVFLLPTSRNHSIELFRSFSVLSRIENYGQTIEIFKTSPIFGVGFNNICLARNKFIGYESFSSHACSGSDSSLLLVLATTGLAGLFVFCHLIYNLWIRSTPILKSTLIALFVHSLFSNSIFYPWIMGYLIILSAITLRRKIEG